MKILFCCLIMLIGFICFPAFAATGVDEKTGKEFDVHKAKNSEVKITFLGHGSLMVENQDRVYHIDPWSNVVDYSKNMPKADIIFISHEHFDHYDSKAVKLLSKENTKVVCNKTVYDDLDDKSKAVVLANWERAKVAEVFVEAFPAYNIKHKRDGKTPFHPKTLGNGYILTIDGLKIYIAGDTENIPEMKNLQAENIDIAFLPFNLPYTMDKEMFVEAANSIKPHILYPYHTLGTSQSLVDSLENSIPGVKVLIRKLE